MSEYHDEKEKLSVVEALLTPEQQSELGSRKRSANPYSASVDIMTNPYSASVGRTNPDSSSLASAAARAGPTFSATSSGALGQLHSQQAAKKQKTSPEVVDISDDDDDICIGEVIDPEQVIARRRKEAEDKGEIIEIS